MLQSDKWERDRDLVMYRGHMYVPKDPQLHHDIVHTHHDSVMTSHPGQWKTLELVSCNYWWQGAMSATAASPSQCRRWGSLPQTGSQPATGRLSLLTPSENYQSLKDTMPSL